MGNKIFRMGKLFSSTDIDGTIEHVGGTATQAYTKGSYFVGDDGYFYAVDDDIDQGDTITLNTNCHKTSIAYELANADKSTVRYNALTDMVQIWDALNQVWVDRWYGGLRNLPYFYKAGSEILSGWNVFCTNPQTDINSYWDFNDSHLYFKGPNNWNGAGDGTICAISDRKIKLDGYSRMHVVVRYKAENGNYSPGVSFGISQRGGNSASEISESFTTGDIYQSYREAGTNAWSTRTYDWDVSGKTGEWYFKLYIWGWYSYNHLEILELSFT